MARCGCASDRCDCHIVAGDNVIVTGTGSQSNPYVVSSVATTVVEGGGGTGGTVERIPGEVIAYGGSAAPAGWLMCDGSVVSRTVYSDLFAVIGTTFGVGDGASTFGIPDLRGRIALGADDATYPQGMTGGAQTVQLGPQHLPSHTHSIDHNHPQASTTGSGSHFHDASWRENASGPGPQEHIMAAGGAGGEVVIKGLFSNASGDHYHYLDVPSYSGTSGAAGSSSPTALNVMNPFLAINHIIKT